MHTCLCVFINGKLRDPKPQELQHKLEQLQCKAARLVHSAYTERTPGCVTKSVQDLSWDSLEHRQYIFRLSMIFNIHHKLVEVSGTTEILQLNDSRTRGSHRFKQNEVASSIYKDSFFPWTTSDWSHPPTVITSCTTIKASQAGLRSRTPILDCTHIFIGLYRFYTGWSIFQSKFKPFT